jgi:hypothetical protein
LADTPFSTTFSGLADADVDFYELGSVAATPQHVTCMRFNRENTFTVRVQGKEIFKKLNNRNGQNSASIIWAENFIDQWYQLLA